MTRILFGAVAAAVLLPAVAGAQGRLMVFRSTEDAAHPPDPAVCARAPFGANVQLGASLWSVSTRASDGRVNNDHIRSVGTATACLQLTNLMFPEGLSQRFYVEFDLPDGRYAADGTCNVVSNQVPLPFIILAGCSLKLVSGPAGVAGGSATSNSVFNPLNRPGYDTGSYWTLLVYEGS